VRRESARLQNDITAMQGLARKLLVNDPQQFAIVSKPENWYDDSRWDVHLPEGNQYVLKLVTREIGDTGFPMAAWQQPVSAGRHEVSLVVDKGNKDTPPRITMLVDGRPLIEATEDQEWASATGSSGSGTVDRSQQSPVGKPLLLKRTRHMIRRPDGTSSLNMDEMASGILLWIEQVSE
jgi:hypothetical protein